MFKRNRPKIKIDRQSALTRDRINQQLKMYQTSCSRLVTLFSYQIQVCCNLQSLFVTGSKLRGFSAYKGTLCILCKRTWFHIRGICLPKMSQNQLRGVISNLRTQTTCPNLPLVLQTSSFHPQKILATSIKCAIDNSIFFAIL